VVNCYGYLLNGLDSIAAFNVRKIAADARGNFKTKTLSRYSQSMLIVMAGLPGTGKSTLSRALASELNGSVIDKDRIRAALFDPADIEYSTEQDEFCMRVMLKVAGYLFRKDPARKVFLDGRTFSRSYQLNRATGYASALGQPWRIIECICSDETARKRLEGDVSHPAKNRNFNLYLAVKARFEEIMLPKTVINTDQTLEACIQQANAALL
jgi:predicted kinase